MNENIKSGETYSLDLSKYANNSAAPSITKQAAHYAVSQVDMDPSTSRFIYHFSIDTKQQDKETVVLNLTKSGGGGGCHHDDDGDNKTVLTVNLAVTQ